MEGLRLRALARSGASHNHHHEGTRPGCHVTQRPLIKVTAVADACGARLARNVVIVEFHTVDFAAHEGSIALVKVRHTKQIWIVERLCHRLHEIACQVMLAIYIELHG